MTELKERLVELIRAHGPIDIGRFMTLALIESQHGYYAVREPIGRAGDFTTAPEISQMFGELIGAFLAQCWLDMGSPHPVTLLEFGPGRGTLMTDALRATKRVPGFHDAISLTLLEGGQAQRRQQAQSLGEFAPVFVHTLDECRQDHPLLAVGNEFLDALPIRQFYHFEGQFFERLVGIDASDALIFVADRRPVSLAGFGSLPEGAVVEIAPAREAFVGTFCALLKATGGVGLLIDYGDTQLDHGDTLQAVRHHSKAKPLENPGMQDISSRVAFGPLAECANTAECHAYGPIHQATLLDRLGAELRLESLCARADSETAQKLRGDVTRLTAPEAMGTLFKAMSITSTPSAPPGFSDEDRYESC